MQPHVKIALDIALKYLPAAWAMVKEFMKLKGSGWIKARRVVRELRRQYDELERQPKSMVVWLVASLWFGRDAYGEGEALKFAAHLARAAEAFDPDDNLIPDFVENADIEIDLSRLLRTKGGE